MRKAVFWDSDGTLLYSNESFKCSLVKAFDEVGQPLTEDIARHFLKTICPWYFPEQPHADVNGDGWWDRLLSQIGDFANEQAIASEAVPRLCARFRQNVILYNYQTYPDALSTLQKTRKMGYENYIISNNFPELVQVFKRLGLDGEISGYFLSADIGYEKPRREIFDHAVIHAGKPDVCYMVGDNPVADYLGGLQAGMRPILVHTQSDCQPCCLHLTEVPGHLTE